ncbi:hypothetical protein JCM6882_006993 [Rhodosporidiobolus microsporus]
MSLFGAPAAGATSSAPSFSFGAPAASAAPATSTPSLFGSTPAPSAAPATGGLFGAAPKPATPSLFGSTPAPGATPAPTGGLFGSAAPAASAAAAPKPAFSFGTPAAAPAGGAAPAAGGGLFGSTTTPAPAAAGGGLFGAGAAPAPAAGGGLFGAKPAAPAGGGLFGSTAAPAAPAFGSSLAAPAAAAQPGAPAAGAAPGAVGGINKNTKFNDLPEGVRNVVEEMDKFFRSQSQLADELKKKDLGAEIVQAQRMYEQYASESSTTASLLTSDQRLLHTLRAELDASLSALSKTTTLIEAYKGGSQGPKAGEAKQLAAFPYEYFRGKADEMRERVGKYRATMEQISSLLLSTTHAPSPSSIAPTLKAQHTSLVSLASAVSALDLELKGLKDEFRLIWREKTGRGVDPFRLNGAGNEGIERGVGGMAIR